MLGCFARVSIGSNQALFGQEGLDPSGLEQRERSQGRKPCGSAEVAVQSSLSRCVGRTSIDSLLDTPGKHGTVTLQTQEKGSMGMPPICADQQCLGFNCSRIYAEGKLEMPSCEKNKLSGSACVPGSQLKRQKGADPLSRRIPLSILQGASGLLKRYILQPFETCRFFHQNKGKPPFTRQYSGV